MRRLFKAFSRKPRTGDESGKPTARQNVINPAEPFFAIGDIHGCIDLLDELLERIDPRGDQRLVFIGDYVDRGPESASVLAKLQRLSEQRPDHVTCLMGNHEKMMMEFIDDPLGKGARWLRHGGVSTLRSYGIVDAVPKPNADQAMDYCDQLEAALPAGLVNWLSNLPLSWNSGNIWCTHAAMDPDLPPNAQKSRTMLWGHPQFMGSPRNDVLCIVHGHTIVEHPINADSRISIDTSAYNSGRLTAAHLSTGQCTFITASGRT